jgi:hypothetical protein
MAFFHSAGMQQKCQNLAAVRHATCIMLNLGLYSKFIQCIEIMCVCVLGLILCHVRLPTLSQNP